MSLSLPALDLHSPAKINLSLSVHGQRADGFHELSSCMVALDFGDRLKIQRTAGDCDSLHVEGLQLTHGRDNLILQAADLFRQRTGCGSYFRFDLLKRIPIGAGLGGGSSNAATALRAMNQLMQAPLEHSQLMQLAAEVGSDCSFFLQAKPSLVSGRGERIAPIESSFSQAISGMKVLLFRPNFSISTADAYRGLLAAAPHAYQAHSVADIALDRLIHSLPEQFSQESFYNSFEYVLSDIHPEINAVLCYLRQRKIPCLLSGSGSCCWAILPRVDFSLASFREYCSRQWGELSLFLTAEVI
jgi:4-diphosphocytidyl-2-C-methyl-D-erythritol kinase